MITTITTITVPTGTSVVNVTQESGIVMIEFAPKFKEGDFLYSDAYGQEIILIFKKIHNNRLYYYVSIEDGDHLDFCEINSWANIEDFRLATEVEQQQLIYMMKKDGKQWNAEKLCIEDIPQRKFNPGDKVKLKDGVLDKRREFPYFTVAMDKFIGKELTVGGYSHEVCIYLNEAGLCIFAEDWLEPYSNKPIVGELAIFWDFRKKQSRIRIYTQHTAERHRDHQGMVWENAIKFESKEQFLEHLKD